MLITVRTFGSLTSIIGGHQVQAEVHGATVKDLLDALISKHGTPLRSFLYPGGGDLSDLLFILINGKNIAHLAGTASVLKDGDVVSILPITAGG